MKLKGFPQKRDALAGISAHTNVLMEARGFYIIWSAGAAGYSGDPRGAGAM
jgi:hypothetical protein